VKAVLLVVLAIRSCIYYKYIEERIMRISVPRYIDTENTLRIESFYHITVAPRDIPWNFPLHNHENFLEISLIIDGRADFECEHKKYTLEAGDLVVKNAGVLHSEISSVAHCFEQYCLGISGINSPGLPSNTLIPSEISPVIHTKEAFDYLRAMTKYLFELSNDPKIKASEVTRQAVENEISVINMLIMNTVEFSEHQTHSELIENVLHHIDNHYGEPFSLDTLAKKFYVSSYHLAHRFKHETGQTVNQYVLKRRLGEAELQLVFGSDSIKEIAAHCGYNDLHYFYSVFKKHTGNTPNEIRSYYKTIKATTV